MENTLTWVDPEVLNVITVNFTNKINLGVKEYMVAYWATHLCDSIQDSHHNDVGIENSGYVVDGDAGGGGVVRIVWDTAHN